MSGKHGWCFPGAYRVVCAMGRCAQSTSRLAPMTDAICARHALGSGSSWSAASAHVRRRSAERHVRADSENELRRFDGFGDDERRPSSHIPPDGRAAVRTFRCVRPEPLLAADPADAVVEANNAVYLSSIISSTTLRSVRVATALRRVRIAFAVCPCLPIMRPRSSGATRSSSTDAVSPWISLTSTASGLLTSRCASSSTSSLMRSSRQTMQSICLRLFRARLCDWCARPRR
jgi:hypothetical protein